MQPPSRKIHISIRIAAKVPVRLIDSQQKKLQIQRKQSFALIIVPALTSMCVCANDFAKLVGTAQRRRFNSSASGVDCRGSARTLAAAPLKHSVKTPHPRAAWLATRCSERRAAPDRFPGSGWSLASPSAAGESAAGLCAQRSPLSPRG